MPISIREFINNNNNYRLLVAFLSAGAVFVGWRILAKAFPDYENTMLKMHH